MNETEVGALRQKLASRVRSDDYRQRRKDMDSRSLEYKIAPDVTVEPATANGVRAEWSSTPNDARDAALIWLHGGGYVIGSLVSHRHLVSEAGRAARIWALALDYRLAPGSEWRLHREWFQHSALADLLGEDAGLAETRWET